MVNTNGLTIARGESAVLDVLRRHRDRVEVYLQHDGFDLATHRHHRGADLRRVKAEAVALLSAAKIFTTLTMTIAKGVNDHEIGAVVDLALATPYVSGVSLQPQFCSGRSGDDRPAGPADPHRGAGPPGATDRRSGDVAGPDGAAVLASPLLLGRLPVPDGRVGQRRGGARRGDRWSDLLGSEMLAEHLGLVANKGMADPAMAEDLRVLVRESLMGLLSERSSLTHPETAELFRVVCESCDLGVPGLLRLARAGASRSGLRQMLAERVVRITVKPFMDIDTMIEERLLQCCVHVGHPLGGGGRPVRALLRRPVLDGAQRSAAGALGGDTAMGRGVGGAAPLLGARR